LSLSPLPTIALGSPAYSQSPLSLSPREFLERQKSEDSLVDEAVEDEKERSVQKAKQSRSKRLKKRTNFDSLDECHTEYDKLYAEYIKGL
jgi:hypothetical protein